MMRKDEWSKDDDGLLISTVLLYIKNGNTQLQAFEDVGQKIQRTAAACGFRWNSNLRHNNIKNIVLAKQEKLKLKMKRANSSLSNSISIDDVIMALKQSVEALRATESLIESTSLRIHNVSLEIDRRRSELILNSNHNKDALAKLILKADELALLEHNKKPAI